MSNQNGYVENERYFYRTFYPPSRKITLLTNPHSEKLVEFNLEKGINGFYAGGCTDESTVLTAEELYGEGYGKSLITNISGSRLAAFLFSK